MTTKKYDQLLYKNDIYNCFEINGSAMFNPADVGLELADSEYRCAYKVEGGELILEGFSTEAFGADIKLAERIEGPAVLGKSPKLIIIDDEYYRARGISPIDWQPWSNYIYESLDIPIKFTGTLQIGTEFLVEAEQCLTENEPSYYEEIHELTFERGTLVHACQYSVETDED